MKPFKNKKMKPFKNSKGTGLLYLSSKKRNKVWDSLGDPCLQVWKDGAWVVADLNDFVSSSVFRIVRPTIDWDKVNKQWNYVAMDECGDVYLYDSRPRFGGEAWCGFTVGGVDYVTTKDKRQYNYQLNGATSEGSLIGRY